MKEDSKSITALNPELIVDFFRHLPRQGPGSDEVTKKAFILPENCWTDHYYVPMLNYMDTFLEQHHHCEAVKQLIAGLKEEITYYEKYKAYYGFAFYIGQKN